MIRPDHINAAFELSGGFFIALSIVRLLRDKEVRGVHWVMVAFYFVWGLWNFYYYAHLGQWTSLVGGAVTTGANLIWIVLMLHYIRMERLLDADLKRLTRIGRI